MTYAVQASNDKFYTGRAGSNWLATHPAEAFTYSQEGAERKAKLFNAHNGPLTGLTFKPVKMHFGTGEYENYE
jgi:hypothetical protein